MIRGEYDPDRIRRLKDPLRRAWARAREAMAAEEPGGPPPPVDPSAKGKLHRVGLGALVIGMSALLIALLTIPGAALVGRLARNVAGRLEGGPTGIGDVSFKIAQRSVIFASGGQVIATLAGEENRMIVPLDQVPEVAQEAVIAIEDARFYEHNGVDMGGMFRALFTNIESGSIRQGGSTITQQLVKNIIVGAEKSLDRKIREAQYAIALEREKSKREILELYLNEAYFGEGIYGIGTAAEYYFGKKIAKVTLAEAALLAAIIRAPERYGPLSNAKNAVSRRNLVLDRMALLGYATRVEADGAKNEPVKASAHALPKPVEPYFVEFVKDADPRQSEVRARRDSDRAADAVPGRPEDLYDARPEAAEGREQGGFRRAHQPEGPRRRARIDRALHRQGEGDGRRQRLREEQVQPRGAGEAPGRIDLQALHDDRRAGGRHPAGRTRSTRRHRSRLPTRTARCGRSSNYSHRRRGVMDHPPRDRAFRQLVLRAADQQGRPREGRRDGAQSSGSRTELKPYLSLALGTSRSRRTR